ncbi:MAG: sugar transferase [Thermosynechococcaceae cyanobacterium]
MTTTLPLACAFETTRVRDVLLVLMLPRLSVAEAPQFRQIFQGWLEEQANLTKIILDFGQTAVVDSSGIGALVSTYRLAKARSLDLLFWGLTPQVKFVFSLAGLESVLELDAATDAINPTHLLKTGPQQVQIHPSVRSRPKRVMDIVGALVGLAVTGVLFVPVAIAIRLNSRGPILFSQTRCGLMGRRFRIWKFRSMVSDAEALKSSITNEASGAFFKNDQDPRITGVGRFIRKTSLDEFPQFWNVLIGDMSLIGTRPPTPDEIDQYQIPNWQRLDVRPGISGEWQVNGRSKVREFEDVIQMDLKYQANWSLVYDLKLLIKTVLVVFSKDSGAV